MDLRLTEEHEALRKTVEAFAQDVVAPVIGDYYARGEFPYPLVAQMGRMGSVRSALPRGVRRDGRGLLRTVPGARGTRAGRLRASRSRWRPGSRSGAMPIFRFGTEEQKQRWLPHSLPGRAGRVRSHRARCRIRRRARTRTTARATGDEWVINGTKEFITNSGTDITALVTVTAVTGGTTAARRSPRILVPVRDPGIHASRSRTQGRLECSDTHGLSFDDCPGAGGATCSASAGAVTRTSCPFSTRAASRSPRWPSVWRRAAWT